jgi:hypothetical protein
MTRGQLKTILRFNLADIGVTFYSDENLNDSIQDAYDDVACLCKCITKSVTLSWIPNLSYYDFVVDCNVSDYMGTIGIFNNVTNRWLRDDLTLRHFDGLRIDWENWSGTPEFWTSSDPKRIAIAAKYPGSASRTGAFASDRFTTAFFVDSAVTSVGTFSLLYCAVAPTLTADTDTPLIATDMQYLLEYYVTADMLETAEEFIKAQDYWNKYYSDVEAYAERVKRNNTSDLLLRL